MKKEEILEIIEKTYAIDFKIKENTISTQTKLQELGALVSTGNIVYLIEFAVLTAAIQNIDM